VRKIKGGAEKERVGGEGRGRARMAAASRKWSQHTNDLHQNALYLLREKLAHSFL
jgi:hypothetical protein